MTWPQQFKTLLKEPWIRFCLLFPGSRWRDPMLYAHELVGDDFWILSGRWDTYCKKISPARIHSRLGWSQGPISAENPLGLLPQTAQRLMRDGRSKALFYGDSFVGGQALEENWIPNLLERQLCGLDVLHLGVGGYGPDQMHLLFKETAALVDRPRLVLMGLMPFAFDRAAQRVRSYQKPFFELRSDGTFEVTNVPIHPEPNSFFRTEKLSFWSYALAAKRNRYDPHRRGEWGFQDKVPLNRAIIAANQRLAQELGTKLLYVIFRDQERLVAPAQREQFFIRELEALGVDTLDTAPMLLDYARERGIDLNELYAGGHHNDLGNQVIAAGIAKEIERRGLACRAYEAPVADIIPGMGEAVASTSVQPSAGREAPQTCDAHWFPVAFRRDLEPGRVERVSVLGRAMALFLDSGATPAVLVDRCPHRSARLSDGRVRDGTLECLYHGWRFDATGRCVHAPQLPMGSKLPERACAERVPSRVEQGIVWVFAGEPGREADHAVPTIAALDGQSLHTIDFTMDLPYGQDYFVENVLDVAHIHVAHAGTRGGGDRSLAGPLEFEIESEGPAGFRANFRTLGLAHARRTQGLRRAGVEFRAPNLVHFVSEFEDEQLLSGLALYSTPSAAGSCRMLYRAYGNLWSKQDLKRPRWLEHLAQCYLLEEDMAVVRGQAQEIDGSRESLAKMWTPLRTSDQLVLRYREWVERHAADRPGAVGLREVGARGVLSQDAKLDRWTLHTRHCVDCRAAHARLSLRASRLSTGSFIALAGAAAASGPLAWCGAALALSLYGLGHRDRRNALELTRKRDVRASRPS